MILSIGTPYPKQIQFFEARTKYIAYGGARGKQLCLLTGQNR